MNAPSPGQAAASADGQEWTFETVGPVGCTIDGTEFTFSFLHGDNDANLIGGGDTADATFRFDISIIEGGNTTNYFADSLKGDTGTLATDGSSISYMGSMQMIGEDGNAASVGAGSIAATCQ